MTSQRLTPTFSALLRIRRLTGAASSISFAWTGSKGLFQNSWGSFTNERDEIFSFIRDEGISGAFLVAGDSRRPPKNVIPWSRFEGYDLYEVISSPLAQEIDRSGYGRADSSMYVRPTPVDATSV